MTFEPGQRVRIPHRADLPGHVRVEVALPGPAGGWTLFVEQGAGAFAKVDLTAEQAAACEVLTEDGAGDSAALLAGLWTAWMRAAGAGARSAVLASSPLRPYAHQMNAVYGAMLPQPRLRFLLADEPGTGKTIMAGLYLREMQRLGFVRSALIVVPGAPGDQVAGRLRAVLRRRPAGDHRADGPRARPGQRPRPVGRQPGPAVGERRGAGRRAPGPDGLGRRRVRRGAPAHPDRRRLLPGRARCSP